MLVSILLSTVLSFAGEHRVVKQMEGAVFVDCGRGDGVKVGDTLWDEVPVAKLRVWFVGERTSVASVEEKPLGNIFLGDIVRLPRPSFPPLRPRRPRTLGKTSSLRFSWTYVGYGSEGGVPDYYHKAEAGYRHFFFKGVGIRMGLGGYGASPRNPNGYLWQLQGRTEIPRCRKGPCSTTVTGRSPGAAVPP